jgi:ribonuclease HI
MRLELWTDGSGIATGGQPMGWAYVLRAVNEQTGEVVKEVEGSGGDQEGTNNRAELTAVIEGLLALTAITPVTVCTDSEYVMHGITKGWVATWRENGWRTREGDPVKNKDLWQLLANACDIYEVSWRHVKGHLFTWSCPSESCTFSAENGRKRKCPECSGPLAKEPVYPLNDRCDILAGAARKAIINQQAVAA